MVCWYRTKPSNWRRDSCRHCSAVRSVVTEWCQLHTAGEPWTHSVLTCIKHVLRFCLTGPFFGLSVPRSKLLGIVVALLFTGSYLVHQAFGLMD